MLRPISNRETSGRCTTVIAYPEPAVPLDELADIECLAMIYRRHAAPIDHTPFPWSAVTYTDFIFALQSTGESHEILMRLPASRTSLFFSIPLRQILRCRTIKISISGRVTMQKLCCYAFGPPFGQFLFIVKKYCSFLENMIVRIVVNTREESLLEDLR